MNTKVELGQAVFGDPEAIDAVAAKIDNAGVVDINQIADEAAKKLEFRQAVRWFEGAYATELKDPFLKQFIYTRDAELAASNPQLSFKTRLQLAGDEARAGYQRTKGQHSASDEEGEHAHTERDVSQRRPAVRVRAVADDSVSPPEEDGESLHSIINDMAKARGQTTASIHRWKVR